LTINVNGTVEIVEIPVEPASKVFSVDSREYLWLSPEGRELSEPVYT